MGGQRGMPMRDYLEKFFHGLFGDKRESDHILLWKSRPKKFSYWFQDINEAITYVKKHPKDIYVGIGTSPKNFGLTKRCKEQNIASMKAFYTDIDVADPVAHKSKTLPPSLKDAVDLVYGHGLDPTWTVNSGHGLHAYWIFKESWLFEDKDDWIKYKMINKRLSLTIKQRAEDKGWTIDSVFDVARVLRPVGSLNCKDTEIEVQYIYTDGMQFESIDAFDGGLPPIEYFDQTSLVTEEEKKIIGKNITLKADAEPSAHLLDMSMELDSKFSSTWQKKRKDMKDQSTSSYHMSLATQAVQMNWPDQEIANLLIAWNRRHGEGIEKPMRLDYIEVTLAKAKKNVGKLIVEQYEDEVEPILGTEYQKHLSEQNREKVITFLSQLISCQIYELVKYCDQDEPSYKLRTSVGDVKYRNTDELLSQTKFRNRFFGQTNHSIEIPRGKWGGFRQALTVIIHEVHVTVESTIKGKMKNWLTEYLDDAPQWDQDQAVMGREPFVKDGFWHLYMDKFQSWVFARKGVNQKFTVDMDTIGAKEKRIQPINPYKDDQTKTSRVVWRIPKKICSPTPTPSKPTKKETNEVIDFQERKEA
jgi:hypothetical protein